jgi:response regulator NasT
MVERHDYTLALLDVHVPGVSGIEVGRRICGSVPFLIISSDKESAVIIEALEAGARGYLIKPTTGPVLVAKIKEALERIEQAAEMQAAINSNRTIARAVGILQANFGHTEQQAFEALRTIARDEGRKAAEVAEEITVALERINAAGRLGRAL